MFLLDCCPYCIMTGSMMSNMPIRFPAYEYLNNHAYRVQAQMLRAKGPEVEPGPRNPNRASLDTSTRNIRVAWKESRKYSGRGGLLGSCARIH